MRVKRFGVWGARVRDERFGLWNVGSELMVRRFRLRGGGFWVWG